MIFRIVFLFFDFFSGLVAVLAPPPSPQILSQPATTNIARGWRNELGKSAQQQCRLVSQSLERLSTHRPRRKDCFGNRAHGPSRPRTHRPARTLGDIIIMFGALLRFPCQRGKCNERGEHSNSNF
jgi:hypothetical protein